MLKLSSWGSAPVHIAPSRTTLNPRSEICFWRSGFKSLGSYQGSDLMTELIPRNNRIRPNSSMKNPVAGSTWIRDKLDPEQKFDERISENKWLKNIPILTIPKWSKINDQKQVLLAFQTSMPFNVDLNLNDFNTKENEINIFYQFLESIIHLVNTTNMKRQKWMLIDKWTKNHSIITKNQLSYQKQNVKSISNLFLLCCWNAVCHFTLKNAHKKSICFNAQTIRSTVNKFNSYSSWSDKHWVSEGKRELIKKGDGRTDIGRIFFLEEW